MNMLNDEQLAREQAQHTNAFNKFKAATAEQEVKNDGSNTPFARQWKRYCFQQILDGLQGEIADPNKYVRSSKATDAVKKCLGIPLVVKKRPDGKKERQLAEHQKNYFDLELSAFVALQMLLDNALSPSHDIKGLDKKTGKIKKCYGRKTRDELARRIGERVEQQLYFKYVNDIYPEFFKKVAERCDGGKDDMPRSSSSYWRYNMERAIKGKKEQLIKDGNYQEANLLDWKPFTYGSKKHIGNWLMSACIKYTGLFSEQRIQEKASQQVFIVLSDWAQANKEEYFANHQPFIFEDLPMICVPVEASADNYGSWLTTVEQSKPFSNKGTFRISQQHLDYVNNLQQVPYKINPFVAAVMDILYDKKIKLGKFKPHEYVKPPEVNQLLGLQHITDRDEQTRLVVNHPDYKQARRERSRAEGRQVKAVERGIQSREVYVQMCKLRDYPELYYPYHWDGRGRVYSRCTTSPSPQGTDYSKALLQFAKPRLIDNRTRHYLAIDLANSAGKDKLNFDQRLKWTQANEKNIILVAKMLDDDGDFTGALSFLEGIASESPFQFLASADEYYHCFIKKDRTTTSVRVGVDMTCSGAGLMAGIRRCKTGASLVNVSPTDEPQDLYRACWDALVKLNNQTRPVPPISPNKLFTLTENKQGRALAKKMVMVAQYSAGIQRQMQEFYELHDDLPDAQQFDEDELKAFRRLWQQALAEVCSFTFVVEWFQARVQEIYDSGRKEVLIPTPNGSVQEMKYPIYKPHRVQSFHQGSLTWMTEYEPIDEPDLKKWMSSITANAIHSLDGCLLALALADFTESFSTIHDAVHTYAGTCMDEMLMRLKQAYVDTVSFDIWTEFLTINGLEVNATTAPPIVGNLDLKQVLNSDYIFA